MTLNWSDISASVIGGVIAGFALVLVQLVWLRFLSLYQRRKAIGAIRAFFNGWEESINTAEGVDAPEARGFMSKEAVQFAKHEYYLEIAPIRLSGWGKYIPARQNQDIIEVIAVHKHAYVRILPSGASPSERFYENFFSRVREIKGLKW